MGWGSYSTSTYHSVTAPKVASGTTFGYTTAMRSTPPSARKAHESLDPTKVAGSASPLAGQPVREARDNAEHPTSLPIVVLFDETGSMGNIPKAFIAKLPELFSLLLRKGYVEHPQVLMGAVGDAYSDHVPLQIGQFESDNRIDEVLDNIYLEGNGGGGNHESYDLAFYYFAHHTATDSLEKRGKKGYLFVIGDERTYEELPAHVIEENIGAKVQGPIKLEDTVAAVKEKWETFFIFPTQGTYPADTQVPYWRKHFGDNVLVLQDANDVAELIAITIGTNEGVVDLDAGLRDLDEVGAGSAKGSVSSALEKRVAGGSVVNVDIPTSLETSIDDTERL